MKYLDLLTDSTRLDNQVRDFEQELDEIDRMHRFLTNSARSQFDVEYERLLSVHNPENYDGGDAIFDAEQRLGINPWDVDSHAGLMAISRAVSLAEVSFARMAASLLVDPNALVFPREGLWPRSWEREFFASVLVKPIKIDGGGFGAIRSLRDLYAHGYGIPATEQRRTSLARRLYNQFPPSPADPTELELGYPDEVYYFGSYTQWDAQTQSLVTSLLSHRRADISALATHRLLGAVRHHLMAVHEAVSLGARPNLDETNCSFVRIALARPL